MKKKLIRAFVAISLITTTLSVTVPVRAAQGVRGTTLEITDFTAWNNSQAAPLYLERNTVVTSPELKPDLASFQGLSIVWRDVNITDSLVIEYRTQHTDGQWGAWYTISRDEDSESAPSGKTVTAQDARLIAYTNGTPPAQHTSELSFEERSRAIQLRVSALQTDHAALLFMRLVFTNIDHAQSLNSVTAQARAAHNSDVSSSSINSGKPVIIDRGQWGADAVAPMTWEPEYVPVKKLVVHHTVTGHGGPSVQNSIAVVQSIYYSHNVGNGWGDIGYNYLVDYYGNVFEGRFGYANVVGGHATGHNYGSAGIAMLGNYNTEGVSSSTKDGLGQILGWLAARYGVGTLGSSWFVDRELPNISGHRDINQTSCPGDNSYSQLNEYRSRATSEQLKYQTNRIAGSNRYETARLISQDRYGGSGTADAAVIVNGQNFPDGLAAASLAAGVNGPILLGDVDGLSPYTLTELDRVIPDNGTVYVVGGTTMISEGVVTDLQNRGYTVVRVAGDNRYATAVAIASQPALAGATSAYVVSGEQFADALSASAPGAKYHVPIFLVQQNAVPTVLSDFLTEHPQYESLEVIGGPSAVSDEVLATLDALPNTTVSRIAAGSNRYETATMIANLFFADGTMPILASGTTFPDGLAAGPYAGWLGQPVLLTSPDRLADKTYEYMDTRKNNFVSGRVIGGTAVISDSATQTFDNQL